MLINDLPIIMIKCLALTIIIEILIAFVLKIRNVLDYLNIVLVNVVTNPIVVSIPVYINIKYGLLERNIVLLILEFMTFIVEGLVYKKYLTYKKISPFMISIILNFFSFFCGEIINYFF